MPDSSLSNPSVGFISAIEKAHNRVEPCLLALDRIIAGSELPDQAEFSAARLRLARANLARARVAQEACSHLISTGRTGEVEALRDLRQREIDHSGLISGHIQHWSPERIQGNWSGYCKATSAVLDQVRELVAAERRFLVPLLQLAR